MQRSASGEDDVLSPYLARVVPALAPRLETVERLHRRSPTEGDHRAAATLGLDRERFMRRFRLVPDGLATGPFWSAGPELASFYDASDEPSRRLVRSADGGELDAARVVLLLEYQQLLLNVLGSLVSDRTDELVALTSSAVEDHAVARTAMHLSARARWNDERFWKRDLAEATVFHQRLLATLRRVAQRTYENAPAELGIVFVSSSHAQKLAFRAPRVLSPEALEDAKIARVLSDGIETVFALSPTGAYFGLHDLHALRARLPEGTARVGWRIRARDIVALTVDDDEVIALRGGTWTYRSDARLRQRIAAAEPAIELACAALWPVARRLSAARRGGILVVVDDAEGLAASGTCRADIAVPPAARRSDAPREERDGGDLEELLFEQLQGRSCAELGEAMLFRMACIDGALLVDRAGVVLGFGVIFASGVPEPGREGAGDNAALFASTFGTSIKVSADGPIVAYRAGRRL